MSPVFPCTFKHTLLQDKGDFISGGNSYRTGCAHSIRGRTGWIIPKLWTFERWYKGRQSSCRAAVPRWVIRMGQSCFITRSIMEEVQLWRQTRMSLRLSVALRGAEGWPGPSSWHIPHLVCRGSASSKKWKVTPGSNFRFSSFILQSAQLLKDSPIFSFLGWRGREDPTLFSPFLRCCCWGQFPGGCHH